MIDHVQRLQFIREALVGGNYPAAYEDWLKEAADEIEQLKVRCKESANALAGWQRMMGFKSDGLGAIVKKLRGGKGASDG